MRHLQKWNPETVLWFGPSGSHPAPCLLTCVSRSLWTGAWREAETSQLRWSTDLLNNEGWKITKTQPNLWWVCIWSHWLIDVIRIEMNVLLNYLIYRTVRNHNQVATFVSQYAFGLTTKLCYLTKTLQLCNWLHGESTIQKDWNSGHYVSQA